MSKKPSKRASGAGRNRNRTKDGRRNVIGQRLREIRRSSTPKVTQEDLAGRVAAQHVSLDRTAIYRIEMGTRAVTDLELVALARALRVTITELF